MSIKDFQKFCKKTKLKNQSEDIFKLFAKGSPERLSIYELLSGIILFSMLSWQQKVTLGFSLFDFDNNSSLNKDELQMLLLTYSNSIYIITKFKVETPNIYNDLGKIEGELIHLNE